MGCPQTAFAGNQIDFSFPLPAFPSGSGWACSVSLRCGSERQSFDLTGSGSTFIASVPAEATAAWKPGLYDMFVLATNGTDRQVAIEAQLFLRPDPASADVSQTALEADLARIDAAISAVLNSEGVQSYSIQTQAGQRQVQRMSLADLRAHRSWLLAAIDAERVAMGLQPKNNRWRRIGLKFT